MSDLTEQLVRRIYRDVVHREPDAGGLQFWVGQLDAGESCESLFHLLYAERLSSQKPPPPPPPPPGVYAHLPKDVMVKFPAMAGQWFTFEFTSLGGYVDIELVTIGGSTAHQVTDTVPGLFENRVTPISGSQFRHKPVEQSLAAGTFALSLKIEGGVVGAEFGITARGAVA